MTPFEGVLDRIENVKELFCWIPNVLKGGKIMDNSLNKLTIKKEKRFISQLNKRKRKEKKKGYENKIQKKFKNPKFILG
jgi:hypothetical protein